MFPPIPLRQLVQLRPYHPWVLPDLKPPLVQSDL
jgi:hypothetical protein